MTATTITIYREERAGLSVERTETRIDGQWLYRVNQHSGQVLLTKKQINQVCHAVNNHRATPVKKAE
jgi:hypothetical protein